MAWSALDWTDIKLEEIEKHIHEIYARAEKEIGKAWVAYMEEADANIERLRKEYAKVKEGGDRDAIRAAGIAVSKAKQEKTIYNRRYERLTRSLAQEISHVNETATKYVNGQLPQIYAMNYNEVAEGMTINKDVALRGYSFDLVDASTVRRLAASQENLLPYKTVNGKKDVRWNIQKINSEVTQGIIQGESIPKIAQRMTDVLGMNESSAIRNARTSVTSAQNKGRMDMMHTANDKGVISRKGWSSAHDSRVRKSHQLMDNGEFIEMDAEFGNGLEYPGDPDGDPEEVYNCRCSLIYEVVGFRNPTTGEVTFLDGKEPEEKEEPKKVTITPTAAPAQPQPTGITRNYNNAIGSAIGQDKYGKYLDALDACESDDVKSIYANFQDRVMVGDSAWTGTAKCAGGPSIYWNAEKDMVGDSLDKPYGVFFHEVGHANDRLLARDINVRDWYYSTGWKNGKYSDTIRGEVDSWVSRLDKQMKADFKSNKENVQWLLDNKYLDQYDLRAIEKMARENGVTVEDILGGRWSTWYTKAYVPSYSKAKAYDAVRKEIATKMRTEPDGLQRYGSLSDILEGASKGKIQCGVGHGAQYWKTRDVAIEAFAEMQEAYVSNTASLEAMRQYLPQSMAVFDEMMSEAWGVLK